MSLARHIRASEPSFLQSRRLNAPNTDQVPPFLVTFPSLTCCGRVHVLCSLLLREPCLCVCFSASHSLSSSALTAAELSSPHLLSLSLSFPSAGTCSVLVPFNCVCLALSLSLSVFAPFCCCALDPFDADRRITPESQLPFLKKGVSILFFLLSLSASRAKTG